MTFDDAHPNLTMILYNAHHECAHAHNGYNNMAGEDVFLSDVHIGNFNSPSNKVIIYNLVVPSGGLQSSISTQGTVSTRFVVLVDGGTHAHAQRADGVLDDDGDLVLDRREQLTVIIGAVDRYILEERLK